MKQEPGSVYDCGHRECGGMNAIYFDFLSHQTDFSTEEKRHAHQRELAVRLNEVAAERMKGKSGEQQEKKYL